MISTLDGPESQGLSDGGGGIRVREGCTVVKVGSTVTSTKAMRVALKGQTQIHISEWTADRVRLRSDIEEEC